MDIDFVHPQQWEHFLSTFVYPPRISSFLDMVKTYTDESYTTLLDDDLKHEISTFWQGFTGMPDFGTLFDSTKSSENGAEKVSVGVVGLLALLFL